MVNNRETIDEQNTKLEKLKAGLFFTAITSFGILAGFGFSLSATKKRETKNYPKELERKLHNLHESGADLAKKALLRASIYSLSGFSIFCLCVWKLSGASNFNDFRHKIGGLFPKISKPQDKLGRTEFENLTDLLKFVIEEDNLIKQKKEQIRQSNNNNQEEKK
jgi:hypothetical protein